MNIKQLLNQAKQSASQITINKKQTLIVSAIASSLLIGGTGAAFAFDDDGDKHQQDDEHKQVKSSIEYSGPVEKVTIAQMLSQQSWYKDQKFTMEGHIIKQISPKVYLFSDGTDEIEVKLNDKQALSFSDKDTVRVVGEYDTELFESNQFEVKKLTVL